MKPFPNRTGTFQRIRLSIARELISSSEKSPTQLRLFLTEGIATVVLRLVNGVTVSLDGHYSTNYYDHSAPKCDIGSSAWPTLNEVGVTLGSGVARIAIYPPT